MLTALILSSGLAFAYLLAYGLPHLASYLPPTLYCALLALLLFPGSLLQREARLFFSLTLWRVATPLRPVTWADFLLADVLTSLAKALSDTERAVCHLMTGYTKIPNLKVRGDIVGMLAGAGWYWEAGPGSDCMPTVAPPHPPSPAAPHPSAARCALVRVQACSDASFIIPLGLAAPYAWRLVQCVRVYLDTGARPQLFNALKYSTAFPVGSGERAHGPACWLGGRAAALLPCWPAPVAAHRRPLPTPARARSSFCRR